MVAQKCWLCAVLLIFSLSYAVWLKGWIFCKNLKEKIGINNVSIYLNTKTAIFQAFSRTIYSPGETGWLVSLVLPALLWSHRPHHSSHNTGCLITTSHITSVLSHPGNPENRYQSGGKRNLASSRDWFSRKTQSAVMVFNGQFTG